MQSAIKTLLLSRYDTLGASSRVRSYQYLPFLHEHGVSVTVSPLFSNAYLQTLYDKRTSWLEVIKGYSRRFVKLFTLYRYDVVIIEKELFPFFPAIFERLLQFSSRPYLVDYDDALFHRYDCHKSGLVRFFLSRKIDTVMKNAAVVIAGNHYLAERAEKAGAKKVIIIPTVVDTDHYVSLERSKNKSEITIGWIGTPKTSHYLLSLIPVFENLKARYDIRFVAVGANTEEFQDTPIETWPWSQESEVTSIQQFDIGIMPLIDSPWERGKCGYKLIQYMACGLPVVASPVGVNTEIVRERINGYLATNDDEWEQALITLCTGAETRRRMGLAGREIVEQQYSIKSQSTKLLCAIKQAMQ